MAIKEELGISISNLLQSGKIVAVIDYDISSFAYLQAMKSIQSLLQEGRYLWVVSYEPLQSIFRDFRRAGVNYQDYLGKNLFIVDVFGSFRRVNPGIEGVYTLGGYLDDRVFVLKYRSLIDQVMKKISPEPEKITVIGYLESGMCRLFSNPVRTQKFLWNLREEMAPNTSGFITYIQPECPGLEEFIYLYSDVVFSGSISEGHRTITLAKGELDETKPRY